MEAKGMTGEWREPETLEAWGRALDAASALLILERVRDPRLGGVQIDRVRCERVLAEGRERGMFPHEDALERYVCERSTRGILPDPDADLRGLPPR